MCKLISKLLLCLFFLGGTVMYGQSGTGLPQLTTDGNHPVYYLIKNMRKAQYASYAGDETAMKQVPAPTIGSLFFFTGTENGGILKIKIHNAATNGLCNGVGQWTASGRDWYVKAHTNTYEGYVISSSDKYGYSAWNDEKGTAVCNYYADDAGSIWSFEKATDEQVSAIYDPIKTSAEALVTKYAEHKDGFFLPTSTDYEKLKALAADDEPAAADDKVKAASSLYILSENFLQLPEAGKIYHIRNYGRDNNPYLGLSLNLSTSTDFEIIARSAGQDISDQSTCWMVEKVGGQYRFKNVGTGRYMGKTPGANDVAYRVVDEENAGCFNIYPNDGGNYGATAIGVDGEFMKWHMATGLNLVRWRAGVYTSWIFEEVSPEDLSSADVPDFAGKVAGIAKLVANSFDVEEKSEYKAALAAYEAEETFANANALLESVKDVPSRLWRIRSCIKNLSINNNALPVADREAKAAYLSYAYSGAAPVRCHSAEIDLPEAIWQFIPTVGGYYIYNVNCDKYIGKTSTSANSSYVPMAALKDAGIYALENTKVDKQVTFVCANAGGSKVKYLHVSGKGLMNYKSNPLANSASSFWIKPATELEIALNTVGDASYSTSYLPFAVSGADGAAIYTGTLDATGNSLQLTETEDGVAAKQAMVLVGEAGTSKATLHIGEGTAQSSGVTGTLMPKNVADDASYLTLGRADGKIGFYHFTGTSLAANRAFIDGTLLGSPQGISIVFNGKDVTGIESIKEENTDAPIYDLSGRRVVKTVKGGLYIQNGKKFIAR